MCNSSTSCCSRTPYIIINEAQLKHRLFACSISFTTTLHSKHLHMSILMKSIKPLLKVTALCKAQFTVVSTKKLLFSHCSRESVLEILLCWACSNQYLWHQHQKPLRRTRYIDLTSFKIAWHNLFLSMWLLWRSMRTAAIVCALNIRILSPTCRFIIKYCRQPCLLCLLSVVCLQNKILEHLLLHLCMT